MKHFFSRSFVLFALVVFSINAWSQADFRPGYLVKSNGDTLRGLIDYRTNEPRYALRCTFKSTITSNEEVYSPAEIRTFLFEDGKLVVSVNLPDSIQKGPVFAQRLASGLVKLYRFQNRYFVEKAGRKTAELVQTQRTVSRNGEDFIVPEKKYIPLLNSFFADCPKATGQLDRLELVENALIKVVDNYNRCTGQTAEINKRDVPGLVFSPRLGAWGGVGSFEVTNDRSPQNYFDQVPFSTGAFFAPVAGLEMNFPRTLPGIFFSVEALILNKQHQGELDFQQAQRVEGTYEANFGYLRMPIGIGYVQPSNGQKFLFFGKLGTGFNLALTQAKISADINFISPSETVNRKTTYGSDDFSPTQLSQYWAAIGLKQNKKGLRVYAEARFELERNPLSFGPNKNIGFSRGANFGLHVGAYF